VCPSYIQDAWLLKVNITFTQSLSGPYDICAYVLSTETTYAFVVPPICAKSTPYRPSYSVTLIMLIFRQEYKQLSNLCI
jgi:hypothetical protein